MINRVSRTAVVVAALLLASVCVRAQEAPKNLQVFPKDTGRQALVSVMKQWTQALGVRCDYCHVQTVPGDFDSFDWANDEKEHKGTARHMFRLVQDLNGRLPEVTGMEDARVSCITCHRGLTDPAAIDRVMLETVESDGAAAAVARYRELRERYYGTGSYDFRPRALTPVIEDLAGQKGDLDGALRFAELAVEQNPDDADSHVVLGTLLLQKGDKDGAEAAAKRALELAPDHRQAERLLQQLAR